MSEKNAGREKKVFVVVLLLFIATAILIFSVFVFSSIPIESKEIKVKFVVDDVPGFNLSTEELNFGKIQAGMTSARNVLINNNRDFSVKVSIVEDDSLSGLLSHEKKFFIEPFGNRSVPFTLTAPKEANNGVYMGSVRFFIFKAG